MVDRNLSPNLVSIHLTVSEKVMSTDGRRRRQTTDAQVTTVALLCSSTKRSLKTKEKMIYW